MFVLYFQEYMASSVNRGIDFSFKFDWIKEDKEVDFATNSTTEG